MKEINMDADKLALLIPIVAIISVFSFTSVAAWVTARRKEREAYYKSELLKKLAESQGAGANTALELMREEDRITRRRMRDGEKLGGLMTIAVGIALMVFFRAVAHNEPGVAFIGLIPLLCGVALLIHVYALGTKD
jgi:hypothetical protein